MRKTFDRAYYDRFYRDPRTRAVTPAAAARQAAFIAAYLRHLELPVRRILDIGCGTGTTLRALGRAFPRAELEGVEYSEYLCRRYGWTNGSVVDYQSAEPFDLVVCNDVLAYLDDAQCARALDNIGALTGRAAFLGILTADDAGHYDRTRTDPLQILRPAAWYRRRLGRHFVNAGGGLHLKKPLGVTVWAMDRIA
ncbi:MAG: class I SAM-dependent methyltransferase [Pseudomonadales bacterium]|nr:class I SAM-dependent methyltransferase [Pseudomonadales bacterium]